MNIDDIELGETYLVRDSRIVGYPARIIAKTRKFIYCVLNDDYDYAYIVRPSDVICQWRPVDVGAELRKAKHDHTASHDPQRNR